MLLQKQSGSYREHRRDGTHPHPSCPVPAARKQHAPSLGGRGWIKPSASRVLCKFAQTRGLGSSSAHRSLAPDEMARKSETSSEQSEQAFRWDGMLTQSLTVDHLWQDVLKFRTRHGSSLPDTFTAGFLTAYGLFGSARFEEFAQLHPCFVQLRFTVSDRTTYHVGDFIVFVALNVVEHKNRAISRWQPVHRILQRNGQSNPTGHGSSAPVILLRRIVLAFGRSSSGTTGRPFLRKCISTTLTAMRCSQVEKADSPRNVPILRNNCRKAS